MFISNENHFVPFFSSNQVRNYTQFSIYESDFDGDAMKGCHNKVFKGIAGEFLSGLINYMKRTSYAKDKFVLAMNRIPP